MSKISKATAVLEKILGRLNQINEIAVALVLGALVIVVSMQIILRSLSMSIPWSDELSRYLLIWCAFLGISTGVKRGTHIGIDVVVKALPEGLQKYVRIFTIWLMIIFFGVLTYYGLILVGKTYAQLSVSLGVRLSWIYAAIPVCGIISIMHLFNNFLEEIFGAKELLEEPSIVAEEN